MVVGIGTTIPAMMAELENDSMDWSLGDKLRPVWAGALLASLTACAGVSGRELDARMPDLLAQRIETAHGMQAWPAAAVLAADLTIYFGDQKALEGSMHYAPHRNLVRIEGPDGTLMVFDGERAWVSPASSEASMARFHLLTWPYFVAAPFKLRDPGTRRKGLEPVVFQNRRHNRLRLTFDAGVGDTPDDWYLVYADAETDRLAAMGYIVTYGTPVEEAENEPHAIVYGKEVWVDGLLLATQWWFYHFSEARGPHGDPLGRAELADIRLEPFQADLFVRPDDAREDMLPGAAPEIAE
jgi:hypothetical protein